MMQSKNHSAEKPVDPSLYGDDWIASAWGEKGNEDLLNKGPIVLRPRVGRAVQLCNISPGMRLLDIACGRGEVLAFMCQKGVFGVGLDYSQASVDFARKVKMTHEENNPGSFSLTRADATSLPFRDDSFDRVTMLDIVEHLHPDQLDLMFKEVSRVLNPGGYAVFHTLPNRWLYNFTYPLLHRIFRKIPTDPRNPYEKQIHVNEQDLFRLAGLLDKVGLKYRIWHEQLMPAQARWNAGKDDYNDQRDSIYPLLTGSCGRILEYICITPLKLFFCNDIFGVLWKGEAKAPESAPCALTERLLCRLRK